MSGDNSLRVGGGGGDFDETELDLGPGHRLSYITRPFDFPDAGPSDQRHFLTSSSNRTPSRRTSTPSRHESPPSSVRPSTNSSQHGGASGTPGAGMVVPRVSEPDGLRRELYPIHIFAIAISATIGMGFYVRVGIIEGLGGQAAVVYAYGFLGALCLLIMTCLTILLRIWPIAGALIVFVERFVDKEIGQSVGVLYWLTYCFSFAGLTTTIGQLVSDLDVPNGASVVITIFSLLLPILFNLTDIQIFRNIELTLVSVKLSIVVAIIIIMSVINPKVGDHSSTQASEVQSRDVIFQHPEGESWFGVLMSSMFLASFSYVGIEIVAATAQEAKNGRNDQSNVNTREEEGTANNATFYPTHGSTHQGVNGNGLMQSISSHSASEENEASGRFDYPRKSPFQGLVQYVPIVSAVFYLWSAWVVMQNVAWDDPSQPTLAGDKKEDWSSSIFINSAKMSHVQGLDTALSIVLIINIASTSSTALYVASRTLFGLTFTISKEMNPDAQGWRKWWLYLMKFLSRKSKFDVPYVAVLVSAWGLILPFLKYIPGSKYSTAIDVVIEMGSVSCILVWGWESFAAYRFFKCCRRHRIAPTTDKDVMDIGDNGWYYFHLTISLFAAIMCPIIVFVGGAFTLHYNTNPTQGVATFLIVGIFLGLTLLLKIVRFIRDGEAWWSSLRVAADVNRIFADLTDLKTKHIDKAHNRANRSWYDLGGVIDSKWVSRKLRGN
ncbi:hypothetical protein PFICI_10493 [Pestalotiopsis fici W106-1]|uniref:Amino acid permease/ SLC12A domain-containing protein n=1 Tax=Pestalotiopsis fici (strain W106-1 / CGMCC3.15140) TaxID=1229662 RepID=W3WZW7_PESFW|nr:uncharacterized protein PFICI_10493 [Pestalotiopsis fici W106-1]ETS78431.1 hypothetical protein PFICI_10493 [Pestalotiopsis fici W106-1]